MLMTSAIKLDDNLIISKIGGNTTDFTFTFSNHLGYVVLAWTITRKTYDIWLEEPGNNMWPRLPVINSYPPRWSSYSLVEKFKIVLDRLHRKWMQPA